MLLDSFKYLLLGLLLIFVQFFLIQQVNFGTWILPMPYTYIIFIFPFFLNRYLSLFMAYFLGFMLDGIGDSYGIHSAACVTMAFAKYYVDNKILDIDSIQLQGHNYLTPAYKGFRYYAIYCISLIVIHHLVFFSLLYFKLSSFFTIIGISLLSCLASFLFILLYRAISGRS